jgi:hypothetical protein
VCQSERSAVESCIHSSPALHERWCWQRRRNQQELPSVLNAVPPANITLFPRTTHTSAAFIFSETHNSYSVQIP